MYEVQPLPWDSAFLGFPVGKCLLPHGVPYDPQRLLNDLGHFNLIYLFSERLLDGTLPPNMPLVDTKVVFEKELVPQASLSAIDYFNADMDDYTALLLLAYLSGHRSRFKLDERFAAQTFERLYSRWIEGSLANADSTVIVKRRKAELAGFVTVDAPVDGDVSKIGLIAVAPAHQGQGVATELLVQAEKWALMRGKAVLEVATQQDNTEAMRLYQRCGFYIKSTTYIYHLWKR